MSKLKNSPRFISILLSVMGLSFIAQPLPTHAAAAGIGAASLTVAKGSNFTVAVPLITGGTSIDTVQFSLSYPQATLQCVGINNNSIDFPIVAGTDVCGGGLATGIRGRNNSYTADANIVTITFKALATGPTTIDASASIALDAGNPVLLSNINGQITIYNPSRQHPDGTLIRPAGSNSVYLVEDGTVRPIGSGEVLASYHMNSSEFKAATDGDFDLPGGANVYFREGTLIKGSGPNVYVIDQINSTTWMKRLITSIGFFTGLGYSVADIIRVPDSALGAADGPAIGSTASHPDGSIVKDPNGPNIYMLENGQKRLVGSIPMFNTQRYSFSFTKVATAADLALGSGPNLNFREGAVIKGSSSNIYVVDSTSSGYMKRLIGSVSAMSELGYGFADITNIIDAELPSFDGVSI